MNAAPNYPTPGYKDYIISHIDSSLKGMHGQGFESVRDVSNEYMDGEPKKVYAVKFANGTLALIPLFLRYK